MPINTHFAVKGRDGVTRESALVTNLLYAMDRLYAQGAITDKRLTALSKQLIAANTVGKLNSVMRAVAALGAKSNPARRTRRKNPTATDYARSHGAEAFRTKRYGYSLDEAAGNWLASTGPMDRTERNALESSFNRGWLEAAKKTSARRKNPMRIAYSGQDFDVAQSIAARLTDDDRKAGRAAPAAGYSDANFKLVESVIRAGSGPISSQTVYAVAKEAKHSANPRRRRTNPGYVIPADVYPRDAKRGDDVVSVSIQKNGTMYVAFGNADADWDGRFEFRVAYGYPAKSYATEAGAKRAIAKYLSGK